MELDGTTASLVDGTGISVGGTYEVSEADEVSGVAMGVSLVVGTATEV